MKIVVILSLFLFTAQSFQPFDYYYGVASQLGFNQNQTTDGEMCLNSIAVTVDLIQTLVENNDIQTILQNITVDFFDFQSDIKYVCPYFINDLSAYVVQATNSTDLRQLYVANFIQYYPQIIQQLGYWIQALEEGQDNEAGKINAYIFQILLGIKHPKTLSEPQVNMSKIVPLNNEQKFLTEYLRAYFTTLGLNITQADIEAVINCVAGIQGLSSTIPDFEMQFSEGNISKRIDLVKDLFTIVADGIGMCQDATEVYYRVFDPIIEAFSEDPSNFILQVVSKVVMNFPRIKQSIQQEAVDIAEGQYGLAGKIKAKRELKILQGLVNFAQN